MNMDLPPHLSSSSSSSLVSFPLKWSTFTAHPLICVLCFCFISYIIHLIIIRRPSSKNRQPPKVPGAWPLLGHMDLLTLPFDKFGAMADTYGSIYRIQLGTRDFVVINDSEVVKEIFTTHDKLCSYRSKSLATKYCFDNDYSFNHMPHGSLWREIRKLTVVSLFSNLCVEMQRNIRTSEVNLWFNHLYMLWEKQTMAPSVSVEMNSWIGDMVFFVVFDLIIGADSDVHDQQQNGGLSMKEMGKKYKKVLDEALKLMKTTIAVSDLIPFLEWYDKLSGTTSVMEKKAKEMDSFQDMWLQEYRRRRRHKSVDNNVFDEDDQVKPYMESLLSTIHKNPQFVGLDADTIIKAVCQDAIFGGYSTIAIVLPWALFFVLNNGHVLKKARKELDENIGKERQVEESDLKQLPYIQAIMKETMRLHIPASNLLRFTGEDCVVGGYHVKAGTNLIINQWKIHRDPSVWAEPLEFKPERFLIGSTNEGVDVKGRHFELVPFGSGRRMCPAVTFALRLMHLVLARLIHGFELNISKPDGTTAADTSVISGENPLLQVVISPRLALEAYTLYYKPSDKQLSLSPTSGR